jgi:hypothetical protein
LREDNQVTASVVEAVAVDVVNDSRVGRIEAKNEPMEMVYCASVVVLDVTPGLCVDRATLACQVMCIPAALSNAVKIVRVNERKVALGEGDFPG